MKSLMLVLISIRPKVSAIAIEPALTRVCSARSTCPQWTFASRTSLIEFRKSSKLVCGFGL
jgi:hypothetical protein